MAILEQNYSMLARLINAADQRHKVISQNIANVNTPNYRRLELNFEEALAAELTQRRASAAEATPSVRETPGLPARADGNNVDIDKEIGELGKNSLLQQVYLQLLGTELSQMHRAIETR